MRKIIDSKIPVIILSVLLFASLFVFRFDLTLFKEMNMFLEENEYYIDFFGATLDDAVTAFSGKIFSSIHTSRNIVSTGEILVAVYYPPFLLINLVVVVSIISLNFIYIIKGKRIFPHLHLVLSTSMFACNLKLFISSLLLGSNAILGNVIVLTIMFFVFLESLLNYILNYKSYISDINPNELIMHLIFVAISLRELIPLFINDPRIYINQNYSFIMDILLLASFIHLLVRIRKPRFEFKAYQLYSLIAMILSIFALFLPLFCDESRRCFLEVTGLYIFILGIIIFLASFLTYEKDRYLMSTILSVTDALGVLTYALLIVICVQINEYSLVTLIYFFVLSIYLIYYSVITIKKIKNYKNNATFNGVFIASTFLAFALLLQKSFNFVDYFLIFLPFNFDMIILISAFIFFIATLISYTKHHKTN